MSFKEGDKVVSLSDLWYIDTITQRCTFLGKLYVIEKIFTVTFPDGRQQTYVNVNGKNYDLRVEHFREATEMDLALEGL
jgi:hypothetical protein